MVLLSSFQHRLMSFLHESVMTQIEQHLLTKNKQEEMEQVFYERKSLYEQAADIMIETSNKTEEETVNEIISHVRNNQL